MNIELKQKTILQVIPELETGGAERTVLEVAEGIVAAGGMALVASQGGKLVAELERLGAQHFELPLATKNPFLMRRNGSSLTQLAREKGVDIIHARSRAPAWSALRAAKTLNVPFVTTYHGIYTSQSRLKRYYNSVMARGDYVIANSNYTRETVLQEHAPKPMSNAQRLITIHRGADLRIFSPDQVSESRLSALKNAWGGTNAFKILLPGRLTSWKGQLILLEAIRMLRMTRQEVNLRLILCGSAQGRDAYEASLVAKIEEDGLGEIVKIVGHCDDMAAAYSWADLVISASTRPEAFGRVAIEAQAMARPVIATDHGGAQETVKPGETGFLVPPGEPQAMATALERFLDMSEQDLAKMGAAARINAVEVFSIERMIGATLAVYTKAIAEMARE